MASTAYDPELDDTEWREMNFTEEQIHSANELARIRQPTADELIRYAEKYGPDGILESAINLTQFQYKKVERALKAMMKSRR